MGGALQRFVAVRTCLASPPGYRLRSAQVSLPRLTALSFLPWTTSVSMASSAARYAVRVAASGVGGSPADSRASSLSPASQVGDDATALGAAFVAGAAGVGSAGFGPAGAGSVPHAVSAARRSAAVTAVVAVRVRMGSPGVGRWCGAHGVAGAVCGTSG
jgi:hypothetical protein